MSFPLAQLLIYLKTPPIICGDFTVFAKDKDAPPLPRSFGARPLTDSFQGLLFFAFEVCPLKAANIGDTFKLTWRILLF
jgi:hypothetical protein